MRCNSISVWDGVEERFRKKLAIWKRQFISKGGRLTLIQSIMSNFPIYIMSLFHLLKGVKSRLEKIQRETSCGVVETWRGKFTWSVGMPCALVRRKED